ncbi:hypothetical protein ANG4_0359 [Streptococcus anginosus 1505]|nr:hypothetical protein ANG4_0359 [Streptococcus anginosus 1505]
MNLARSGSPGSKILSAISPCFAAIWIDISKIPSPSKTKLKSTSAKKLFLGAYSSQKGLRVGFIPFVFS